jgi:GMP synthase-like glutamine amidotransferase
VRKSDVAEFGWTEIQILEPSPLLEKIPASFYSFSAHFEEVSLLPKRMKRLASSKDCEIQACQLENLPIFGIQFHPEKNLQETKKILMERKKIGTPPFLLNANRSEELYDPKIGETIFKNFFQI